VDREIRKLIRDSDHDGMHMLEHAENPMAMNHKNSRLLAHFGVLVGTGLDRKGLRA
jgi:hypothetical protein